MPTDYRTWDFSLKHKMLFCFYALAVGMAVGILFYDSPVAGVIISLLLIPYSKEYKLKMGEKRRKELLVQFKDMLYSISASIMAGRSMSQALEESLTFWQGTYDENDYIIKELRYMTGAIKNGNTPDIEVLTDFSIRSGIDDIGDFTSVYKNCKASGGNLPEAIGRATDIISDKITLEKELSTMMAQKIFEGKIVSLTPFALIILLRITSADYLTPLYTTSLGKLITTAALVMMAAALIVMERMNKLEI